VRIADPAKDVSTRWFKEKLFPTDCSPIEDTTLTGLRLHDVKSVALKLKDIQAIHTFLAM
jgi:hypothetical protein